MAKFGVPPQIVTFRVARGGKLYGIRVTLDPDKLTSLINKAIDNAKGRATDAYGALTVVAVQPMSEDA